MEMNQMNKPGMSDMQEEGAEKEPMAKMQECMAKMEQAMSVMKEAMAAMGGTPEGDDRMSVEQAFGKGFQGDEVKPKY